MTIPIGLQNEALVRPRVDRGYAPEMWFIGPLGQFLYKRFSINPGEDIYGYNLIISTTDFDMAHYGATFINDYKQRLGVSNSSGESVTVLRSVVMNAWPVSGAGSLFLDTIEYELCRALTEWIQDRNTHLVEGWIAERYPS